MPSRRGLPPLSFRSVFLLSLLAATSLRAALPPNVVTELRTKAESGNMIAQYNLGLAYADPTDPIADYAEAYSWLSLAVETGSNGKALQTLVAQLSPAQLTEAKRRLETKRARLAEVTAQSPERSPFLTPASVPAPSSTPVDRELLTLRTEKKQLGAELSAAWRETEAAKTASIGKVAELNQQIAARDQQIVELRTQLQSMVRSAPAGSLVNPGALDRVNADLTAKTEALTRAESTNEQLSRDLAILSTEAASLKTQLASEQRARADLSVRSLATTKDVTGELATLRAQYATVQASFEKLQTERSRLAEQLAGLSAEKELLSKKLNESTATAGSSTSALMADLERSRVTLAQRDETATRLSNDVRRLTTELELSKAQPTTSPETIRLRGEVESLNQSVALLEKERDSLRQQLSVPRPEPVEATNPVETEALTRQLAEAESKLSTALRSYTLQREELDAARKALDVATSNQETSNARLEIAAQEKTTLSGELNSSAAAVAENNTLREQLRQTQAQSASLAIELNQLKTKLAISSPAPGSTFSSPTRPGAANSLPASVSSSTDGVAPYAASSTAVLSRPAASASAPPAASTALPNSTPQGSRTHKVQLGDTLSRIAQLYYGQSSRWEEIARANRDVMPNPNQLVVGTTLKIP